MYTYTYVCVSVCVCVGLIPPPVLEGGAARCLQDAAYRKAYSL